MRPDSGPHFLVATEAEASTVAKSIQLDGIEAFDAWDDGVHGLGPEQLAELQCLIQVRECDYKILDEYQIAFTDDEMHGPWLIRIPDEFVSAMASLDTGQLASIGDRWLEANSGFRLRQTPRAWIQRLAERLVGLAQRATEQGKCLYWESPSC